MHEQQAQLSHLKFYFSWGHKDTRKVIQQSLKNFANIARVISFDANRQQQSHEKVQYDTHLKSFQKLYAPIESHYKKEAEWGDIQKELGAIQSADASLAVFYEMKHFLQWKKEKLLPYHPLLKPIQELIKNLTTIQQTIEKEHPDILRNSQYFGRKITQMQDDLTRIDDVSIEYVDIKPGHTGFSEYYDVVIKGAGPVAAFDGFTRYENKLEQFKKDEVKYRNEKDQLKTYNSCAIFLTTQLLSVDDIELDPVLAGDFGAYVQEINAMLAIKRGESVAVEASFDEMKQIRLMQTLAFENLHGETIDAITDFPTQKALKEVLQRKEVLNQRLLEAEKEYQALEQKQKNDDQKTLLSWDGIMSRTQNFIYQLPTLIQSKQTEIATLQSDLTELQKEFSSLQPKHLDRLLNAKKNLLTEKINEAMKVNDNKLDTLNKKIELIDQKIKEETQKSSVMVRRFENIDELLDYSSMLRTMIAVEKNEEESKREDNLVANTAVFDDSDTEESLKRAASYPL